MTFRLLKKSDYLKAKSLKSKTFSEIPKSELGKS